MSQDYAALEARIDQLESRDAIANLQYDYAHGCDNRDADRFMAIWHDDATYDLHNDFGSNTGHAEIRGVLGKIWDAYTESHHWMTNIVTKFQDADHATTEADCICIVRGPDGFEIISATYLNLNERRDGVWRIARCDLSVQWSHVMHLTLNE